MDNSHKNSHSLVSVYKKLKELSIFYHCIKYLNVSLNNIIISIEFNRTGIKFDINAEKIILMLKIIICAFKITRPVKNYSSAFSRWAGWVTLQDIFQLQSCIEHGTNHWLTDSVDFYYIRNPFLVLTTHEPSPISS